MNLELIKEWALTLNISNEDYIMEVEGASTIEAVEALMIKNIKECGWLNLQYLVDRVDEGHRNSIDNWVRLAQRP